MKKVLFVWGMLLSLGVFCACSSDDELGSNGNATDILSPVNSIDGYSEISKFFDSEWSYLGVDRPSTFFPDDLQDVCCMVNSEQEFRELYHGNVDIPHIDFQKYTLVIGKKAYTTKYGELSPTKYEGQKLYGQSDTYVIDLYCRSHVSDISFYTQSFICFWGIYPKLREEKVVLNLVYVD